jgi:nucleoside 2-deoxyribosyltransferase
LTEWRTNGDSSAMELQICSLCDVPLTACTALGDGDTCECECPACGYYRVDSHWRHVKVAAALKLHDRVLLSGVVRNETDAYGRCRTLISMATWQEVAARAQEPRSAIEQMHRFVLHAAERAINFGTVSNFGPTVQEARRLYFHEHGRGDFPRFLVAVSEANLIGPPMNSVDLSCKLTPHGWELADSLQRAGTRGSQAFVAMWFHPDLAQVYDEGIAPALLACGYGPYRVDRHAHGNKIDDEIIANIRKSRLVVADLTGLRPNAFYEAGFAYGLAIPMIITCNEDSEVDITQSHPTGAVVAGSKRQTWFKHVADHAFDVRQYTVLGWKTPADLRISLVNRIRALNLGLE